MPGLDTTGEHCAFRDRVRPAGCSPTDETPDEYDEHILVQYLVRFQEPNGQVDFRTTKHSVMIARKGSKQSWHNTLCPGRYPTPASSC